jgi:hypothetical protein
MVTRADIEAEAEFIAGLIKKAREQVMEPHFYEPRWMHMGDCAICGHVQNAPIHQHREDATPKNTIFINEIWAFVSVDPEDGYEVVLSGPLLGPGSQVPLIAADKKRLESLWPIAREIAAMTGRKCKLVRFWNREEIEEFGGGG